MAPSSSFIADNCTDYPLKLEEFFSESLLPCGNNDTNNNDNNREAISNDDKEGERHQVDDEEEDDDDDNIQPNTVWFDSDSSDDDDDDDDADDDDDPYDHHKNPLYDLANYLDGVVDIKSNLTPGIITDHSDRIEDINDNRSDGEYNPMYDLANYLDGVVETNDTNTKGVSVIKKSTPRSEEQQRIKFAAANSPQERMAFMIEEVQAVASLRGSPFASAKVAEEYIFKRYDDMEKSEVGAANDYAWDHELESDDDEQNASEEEVGWPAEYDDNARETFDSSAFSSGLSKIF